MMRVTLTMLLAVALFGSVGCRSRRLPLGFASKAHAAPRRDRTKDWPREAEGLGLTVTKAQENALEAATEKVTASLRRAQPPIRSWQPSKEFVQKSLIADGEEGKEDREVLEGQGVVLKRWIWRLKGPDWDTFYQMESRAQAIERADRGEKRMLLLAKVLSALLVLMVAFVVYVRIDDKTRGYYTRWLQVAGASLLAGAGAGLWRCFH